MFNFLSKFWSQHFTSRSLQTRLGIPVRLFCRRRLCRVSSSRLHISFCSWPDSSCPALPWWCSPSCPCQSPVLTWRILMIFCTKTYLECQHSTVQAVCLSLLINMFFNDFRSIIIFMIIWRVRKVFTFLQSWRRFLSQWTPIHSWFCLTCSLENC